MNTFWLKKHRVALSNVHLADLLGLDYYIELGNIGIDVLDNLLEGEKINLYDLIDKNQTNHGIGQLSNSDEDYLRQLDFLNTIVERNTTNSFILTSGVVRYYGANHIEKLAPLMLIPIYLNISTNEVFQIANPAVNSVLINSLLDEGVIDADTINHLKSINNIQITSLYEIDQVTIQFSNITNLNISTESYLTYAELETAEFNLHDVNFTRIESAEELEPQFIFDNYYKKINPLTKLNLEQKNCLINARKGLSFVVNGKAYSGKSTTILNIIGDSILNNKKVLYINNDLTELKNMYEQLNRYQLNRFIYDFTQNDNIKNDPILLNTVELYNYDFEKVIDLTYHFDQKINGYSLRYIIEKLAIYKRLNTVLIFDNIENLESHEIEQVSDSLENIARNTTDFDFSNSIWNTLIADTVTNTVDDIIKDYVSFKENNEYVIKTLNSLSTDLGIKEITNATSFRHFTQDLFAWNICKPNVMWFNYLDTQEVPSLINELGQRIRNIKNIEAQEKIDCTEGHSYKDLFDSYQELKAIYTDDIYISRILANNIDLKSLLNQMLSLNEAFISIEYFKDFFKIDSLKDYHYFIIDALRMYFVNNHTNLEWINMFVSNPNSFYDNAVSFINDYKAYIDALNKLKEYGLYKKLTYKQIPQVQNTKILNVFLKRFGIKDEYLVDAVKQLSNITKLSLVFEQTIKDTSFFTYEAKWSAFYQYCLLITSIDRNNLETLKYIFVNEVKDESFFQSSFYDEMVDLSKHIRNTNIIKEKLEFYNEVIADTDYYDVVNKILSKVDSIEHLYDIQQLMFESSKNSELTIDDLKQFEKTYLRKEQISANYLYQIQTYENFFGSEFKGLQTDIYGLINSYKCFSFFVREFYINDDSLKLFKDDSLYESLMNKVNNLEGLYNYWFRVLRNFSSNFKKSLVYLQGQTFNSIQSYLQKYENELDDLEKGYNVVREINVLEQFKLKNVVSYIYNNKDLTNIKNEFMYSVLSMLYNNNLNTIGYFDKEEFEKQLNYHLNYEQNMCFKTINLIDRYNNDVKKDIFTNTVLFVKENASDRRNILFNYDKNKQIYLSSVLTLNAMNSLDDFDIVIVDDAHLGPSNAYNKISKAKQLLIFGDSSFKLSVANGLLQRIPDKMQLLLTKRYISINEAISKELSKKNVFGLNLTANAIIEKISSIKELVSKVINDVLTNKHHIVIYTHLLNERRKIFEYIYQLCNSNDTLNMILNLVDVRDPLIDTTICADNAYIISSDNKVKPSFSILRQWYQNSICKGELHIIFKTNSYDDYIYESGVRNIPLIRDNDILSFIKTSLEEKGITVTAGDGIVNLLLRYKNNTYGLIVFGRRTTYLYSIADEYNYYKTVYEENHIKLLLCSCDELYQSYDDVINNITEEVLK